MAGNVSVPALFKVFSCSSDVAFSYSMDGGNFHFFLIKRLMKIAVFSSTGWRGFFALKLILPLKNITEYIIMHRIHIANCDFPAQHFCSFSFSPLMLILTLCSFLIAFLFLYSLAGHPV